MVGHHRHVLGGGARDRIRDQVREGDALPGVLELLAARVERRDGERAERRRGRDRAALVHVASERRGAAFERLRASRAAALMGLPGPRWRRPRRRRRSRRGREHVRLGDPAAAGGAVRQRSGRRPARRRHGGRRARRLRILSGGDWYTARQGTMHRFQARWAPVPHPQPTARRRSSARSPVRR